MPKPKQPYNPVTKFRQERSVYYHASNPKLTRDQVNALIESDWNVMSEAERQPYQNDLLVSKKTPFMRFVLEKMPKDFLPECQKAPIAGQLSETPIMLSSKSETIPTAFILRVWGEMSVQEKQPYFDAFKSKMEELRVERNAKLPSEKRYSITKAAVSEVQANRMTLQEAANHFKLKISTLNNWISKDKRRKLENFTRERLPYYKASNPNLSDGLLNSIIQKDFKRMSKEERYPYSDDLQVATPFMRFVNEPGQMDGSLEPGQIDGSLIPTWNQVWSLTSLKVSRQFSTNDLSQVPCS